MQMCRATEVPSYGGQGRPSVGAECGRRGTAECRATEVPSVEGGRATDISHCKEKALQEAEDVGLAGKAGRSVVLVVLCWSSCCWRPWWFEGD